MPQKIAKIVLVPFVLLLAFFPNALRAQVFDGGDNPEKAGVAGIECALVSGSANQEACFKCVNDGGEDCAKSYAKSSVASTGNIRDLIFKYVNFALPLLALAAFTGFVYAGFLYVTAYGSEDQTAKAKKVMIYAVIGLVLVILSFSIVQLFTLNLAEGIQK